MRTFSPHLQAMLDQGAATFATCWRIDLSNGSSLFFTDHHADIVVDGDTYVEGGSFSRSAVTTSLGLSAGGLEVTGTLGVPSISSGQLIAGLYDHAKVSMFLVDYMAPEEGVIDLCVGWLGEVKLAEGKFSAQLYGLSYLLEQSQVELYSPTCRAKLGDSRCKVNMASHTWTGAVTSVTSQLEFDTDLALAAETLRGGLVSWVTGDNAGLQMEIKGQTAAGVLTLYLPAAYAVHVGDTFSVTRGCAKTVAACKAFGNVVNMRAEPLLPGNDKILRVVNAR